jgi:hypothetical protein
MKTYLIPILFFLFAVTLGAQGSTDANKLKNTIVVDSASHQRILLGYFDRNVLQDTSFSWWFNSVYDMKEVDSTTASTFINKIDNISIIIVMGTWCSDSRSVVPKLFKILDYIKFPEDKISLIAVGRKKKSLGHEIDNLKIDLVPTIIFYRKQQEIGRIIESPAESLEKDIAKILLK